MSAFGQRRKARVINVSADDGDEATDAGTSSALSTDKDEPVIKFSSKGSRKPFRQSGLRKTLNLHEDSDQAASLGSGDDGKSRKGASLVRDDDDDDDGPVVVRPGMGKAGSSWKNLKKKPSGLSFSGSGDDDSGGSGFQTPKKFGQRVLENSALKKSMAMRGLPTRDASDDESDRPRYSKEYLDELQSSTPNTPQNISALHADDDDSLMFDSSELDGALVMNEAELGLANKQEQAIPTSATTILTDAEIRERKERRARMALEGDEGDYIPLDDSDDDRRARKKKDKKESRLVAEDEDLGEGFDEFVDDGGIALGKTASKEAKRRQRREIADMIQMAEGNSDESSDESEAERRAAYEAAQARAGMDGLKREKKSSSKTKTKTNTSAHVPAKITPLPDLMTCLAQLRLRAEGMRKELQTRDAHITEIERDKDTILERQEEVQRQLEEAGKRYSAAAAAMGSTPNAAEGDGMVVDSAGRTPRIEFAGHRGLESLGTPDARRQEEEEEDLYGPG